jgi:uncharacterized membrane protein
MKFLAVFTEAALQVLEAAIKIKTRFLIINLICIWIEVFVILFGFKYIMKSGERITFEIKKNGGQTGAEFFTFY